MIIYAGIIVKHLLIQLIKAIKIAANNPNNCNLSGIGFSCVGFVKRTKAYQNIIDPIKRKIKANNLCLLNIFRSLIEAIYKIRMFILFKII